MGREAGIDKRIYYRAGAWGLAAAGWLEAANLLETGIDRSVEMAEGYNRQKKIKRKKVTFVDVGITFKVEVDEADTSYMALVAAAEAGTPIPIVVGKSNASGADVFGYDACLEMGAEEHPNGGTVQRSFTAWPHLDSEVEPDWYELTA